MPSHAILMHYPPEALDEIRHGGGTEVLAIGDPTELESFLADIGSDTRLHARNGTFGMILPKSGTSPLTSSTLSCASGMESAW